MALAEPPRNHEKELPPRPFSYECVEGQFSEVRLHVVLRSVDLRSCSRTAYPPARRLTSWAIVGIDATLSSTASARAFTASSRCHGPIAALKTSTEMPGFLRRSSPINALPSPSGR